MALINAYAAFGQFKKAKQVLDLEVHAFIHMKISIRVA